MTQPSPSFAEGLIFSVNDYTCVTINADYDRKAFYTINTITMLILLLIIENPDVIIIPDAAGMGFG